MKTTESTPVDNSVHYGAPQLDKEHGYFSSASVLKSPIDIYKFCQDKKNVEEVLKDLPMGLENFLKLTLISAEQTSDTDFRITWKNNPTSKAVGTLTFILQAAPLNRGTIITVEAVMDKIKFREEGPSTLMNFFLKRMKMLMETGEIASTSGQPSGREEISSNLKH